MEFKKGVLNLIGNWFYVIGLIYVAIAETKGAIDNHHFQYKKHCSFYNINNLYNKDIKIKFDHHRFVAFGEYIETLSNVLRGYENEDPNKKLALYVSALGSGISTIGSDLQKIEEAPFFLAIEAVGDSLQTIGPLIASSSEQSQIIAFGFKIEALGAAIETLGLLIMIQDEMEKGQIIVTIGSWIQLVGGYLVALFETKEIINSALS